MSWLRGFLHSIFPREFTTNSRCSATTAGMRQRNFMYRCFPASQVQSHAWVVLERRRPSHRSPNSSPTFPLTPFHRCVLIHLGVLEIFPGELLVGADLLIGPVFFGSTDVCLIVGRVREDVICFLALFHHGRFPGRKILELLLLGCSFGSDESNFGGREFYISFLCVDLLAV